jgi:hypothetical protein
MTSKERTEYIKEMKRARDERHGEGHRVAGSKTFRVRAKSSRTNPSVHRWARITTNGGYHL